MPSDPNRTAYSISLPVPNLVTQAPSQQPTKLHQVADIENLLGFKGNYMIFPIVNFNNYMA